MPSMVNWWYSGFTMFQWGLENLLEEKEVGRGSNCHPPTHFFYLKEFEATVAMLESAKSFEAAKSSEPYSAPTQ